MPTIQNHKRDLYVLNGLLCLNCLHNCNVLYHSIIAIFSHCCDTSGQSASRRPVIWLDWNLAIPLNLLKANVW